MTAAIGAGDEDLERSKLIIETVTFLLQRIFVMDEKHVCHLSVYYLIFMHQVYKNTT